MATPGLGLLVGRTLEEGVGQVEKCHRVPQREQVRHPFEHVGLDRPAPRQQGIGGPVQAHHAHGLEIDIEEFAERTPLAEPAPGRALRARHRHAADDRAHGHGPRAAVETQMLQEFREAELFHRPQPHVLDTGRTRAHHLQGRHIHRLHSGTGPGACDRGRTADQPGGNALRFRLDLIGPGERQECLLAPDELGDPRAQQAPVSLLHGEIASEVEEGPLPDPVALSFVADEAVGEVLGSVLCGACFGAPDEHGVCLSCCAGRWNPLSVRLCHHDRPPRIQYQAKTVCWRTREVRNTAKSAESLKKMLNMG